jgi:ubiquinone/menaquinone biosynthesis C-methylase UbiE
MNNILTYNDVSSNYDERYKQNSLGGIQDSLLKYIKKFKPKNILEAGCGTGRWLNSIPSYDSKLFGLDLSFGMLSQITKSKISVNLINGNADKLPLKNNSFDFIYCINAIHHFDNPEKFLWSIKEILISGGIFILVGIDPHIHDDTWYAYDFFDGIKEQDLKRIPSFDQLKEWSLSFGFKNVRKESVAVVSSRWIGNAVFKDIFLQKHNSSQLMRLTEEKYSMGILRIKKLISEKPDTIFRTHLTFYFLSMCAQ